MEYGSQLKIGVKILNVLASKLDQNASLNSQVKFNINANLEETDRKSDRVLLKFGFAIVTEPRVVKFQVEGSTILEGHMDNIKKVLEPNHTTKVPQILYDIYQHVYSTLYVLAKAIDAPCPSPGLLSSSPPSSTGQVGTEELEAKPQIKEQETAPAAVQTNESEIKDEKAEVASTQANTS